MPISIEIVDEVLGRNGKIAKSDGSNPNSPAEKDHRWMLEFLDETVTAQEIIRRRIYQEVQDYNLKKDDVFMGLVQPTDTEILLNGFKVKENRKLDWEAQYAKALEAFKGNGFIMLVNDKQVESLEDIVELKTGTQINFLKLVPLVGG